VLAAGSRLGPYEIVAPLGTGGMGEVYRARDPRLRRDVAIKVSAEQFTDRFEREARAIAALNHPHICTLHDVGPNYLVMELIEGPTLAERMRQGPVPLEEALRIAKQIADALDAAHTRGIVHRDLKPANVKLTSDDVVKVLDFGLAKHDESGPADGDPDLSPTMNPATRVGMILGTAAYMAPEQARGRTVDKRADIWAFGVVLYELVSGRRLFQRDTASDTIASVLTFEPEWDAVPGRLRPLLRRCLAKDPRQRLRDIGDLPLLLDAAPPIPPRRPWLAWTVAAAALVALAVVGAVHLRERTPAAQPIKFQIPTTIALSPSGNIGLSPDGRQLAFLGNGPDGVIRMWVRDIDSVDIRPLAGSETASYGPPFFWSPDGRYIAYDAGGQLKRVSLAGELAQTVCPLTAAAIGGSWNKRGDIILGNVLGGLLRVSERGGAPAPVTTLDASRKEAGHLLPTFLPDGTHFIYLRVSRASPEMSGVFVGSLDAKPEAQDMRRLMPYEPGLAYAPPRSGHIGHLLFVHEGTLIAQPFDDRRLQLTGDPMALAQSVGVYLDTAFFSTSQNGTLVYRSGDPSFPITWRDRRGNVAAQVMDAGQYSSASMSADGARGVVSITSPRNRANADLWLIDLAEGRNPSRFTFDPDGRADFPIWSPDGRQIVYRSGGAGRLQLRLKRVGSSPTEFDTLRW